MATIQDVNRLRDFIGEPDDVAPYQSSTLSAVIDAEGSAEAAAYRLWTSKAASYAGLIDISEGGSTRKTSNLYTNAVAMAARFKPWAPAEPTVVVPATRAATRIGTIERA